MNKTSVVDIHKKQGNRPAFDVYIGRAVAYTEFTEDSQWCNPYRVKNYTTPRACLSDYYLYIRGQIANGFNLRELAGKKLGCWCITTDKLEPYKCHGQVLMKLLQEAGLA